MGQRKRTEQEVSEAISIGKKLQEAREAARLTQAELGARIGGRSQRTISDYEAGQSSTPLSVLLRICHELQLDLRWLIEALDPGLASEFNQDEFRRHGRGMLAVLREFILMDIGKVKRDPSLAAEVKKAYVIGAEKLKAVRTEHLYPDSITDFIWDVVRALSRPYIDAKELKGINGAGWDSLDKALDQRRGRIGRAASGAREPAPRTAASRSRKAGARGRVLRGSR